MNFGYTCVSVIFCEDFNAWAVAPMPTHLDCCVWCACVGVSMHNIRSG